MSHLAREPAIAVFADALQGRLRTAANPNRQLATLRRFGLHTHGHSGIVFAVVIDLFVAPAGTEQRNRLVRAFATRAEILAERLKLGRLPTDANAQAHTAARQGIQGTHLLGHQHGLTLRQHQHLGTQTHS